MQKMNEKTKKEKKFIIQLDQNNMPKRIIQISIDSTQKEILDIYICEHSNMRVEQ